MIQVYVAQTLVFNCPHCEQDVYMDIDVHQSKWVDQLREHYETQHPEIDFPQDIEFNPEVDLS